MGENIQVQVGRCISRHSLGFLKLGFMRYLSIVLSTVDSRKHAHSFAEADGETSPEEVLCTGEDNVI